MRGALAVWAPLETARVGFWAWREARRLADRLGGKGLDAASAIAPAPAASDAQRPTVVAALDLAGATCLVRAALLQRWDADHGRRRPLVIGVGLTSEDGFAAHAWLDGDDANGDFVELHRHLPG